MIKYNPKFWLKYLFVFHKSDTIRIMWKELLYIGLFTSLLVFLELRYVSNPDTLKLLNSLKDIFSLIGFVLSLLLVFRTNTAYDRWWEGRKKWGELVNNTRNLAIKISATQMSDNNKAFFARMIPNYAFAMKEHLREGVKLDELDLTAEELSDISTKGHQPNYISKLMYQRLNKAKENQELTEVELLTLDTNLKTFSDIIGACERIKNTPIPFSYSSFLKKFIFIFVTTIPLSFVSDFEYFSTLIAMFIFYVLVSMEILAEEIEDPFGKDENDLPIESLSQKIKDNVQEIILD